MAKKGNLVVVECTTRVYMVSHKDKDYEYKDYRMAKVGSATREGRTKTIQYPRKGGWSQPYKVDHLSCDPYVIYTLPPMDIPSVENALHLRGSYHFDTKEEVKEFLRPFVKR